MATSPPGRLELETIKKSREKLALALKDIDNSFVYFLNKEGFISDDYLDSILTVSTVAKKGQELERLIKDRVALSPESYGVLIAELKRRGKRCEPIVTILEEEYAKQMQAHDESSDAAQPAPSNQDPAPTPKLDPVEMNLKHKLKSNWEDIQTQFASYTSCLCQRVKQTGVSVEDFHYYLVNLPAFKSEEKKELCELFAHAKEQLNKADTIIGIFNILSDKCTSFLNCQIFLSIQKKYDIPNDCEELNYYEHLEEFVLNHKISELSEFIKINPKLHKLTNGSEEEVIVKFDISLASKLDKLLDLRNRISTILKVMPSALRLFSVKDGCVVVTFLIPTQLAQILFTSEKEFTAEEVQEFQALSVLWLECNHHKFEFGTGRKANDARLRCSKCCEVINDGRCEVKECEKCIVGGIEAAKGVPITSLDEGTFSEDSEQGGNMKSAVMKRQGDATEGGAPAKKRKSDESEKDRKSAVTKRQEDATEGGAPAKKRNFDESALNIRSSQRTKFCLQSH